MKLIFQIHPLVLDVRRRDAHFPITIGFCFLRDADEVTVDMMDDPWLNPRRWTEKDRRALWHVVLSSLTDAREQMGPPPKREVREAILTVSARIQVTVPNSSSTNTVVEEMMTAFKPTGQIITSDIQVHTVDENSVLGVTRILQTQLELVESCSTSQEKGEALEKLMASLFSSVPGFRVKNRVRTETEEIDLTILNNGTETRWRNEGPLMLAECKNCSSKCGKNELVQFKEKILNRRGRCSLGFLVSWNGFAETFKIEILRGSRENIIIIPLDGEQIRRSVLENSFFAMLCTAWDTAVAS
jgi:hypothetical protein